jgi:hypothetical protein
MVYVVCGLGCVTICVEVTTVFWISVMAQAPRSVNGWCTDMDGTRRSRTDRQQRHHADPPNSSMHTITPPSPMLMTTTTETQDYDSTNGNRQPSTITS